MIVPLIALSLAVSLVQSIAMVDPKPRVSVQSHSSNVTLNPMPDLTKAQYAGSPAGARLPGGRVNASKLYSALQLTKTNTYNYLLYDKDGVDYLNFVEFLDLTSGTEMYAWVTLIPPSETRDGECSIPSDSPLTHFNETSYFDQSMGPHGCNDYAAWGTVLGLLGRQFPHLVAANIDDFTDNVGSTFTAPYVATIRANLNNGGVRLWPTFYFSESAKLPWLVGATDGIMFYFGTDPGLQAKCRVASCDPLATCVLPCLYHNCSNMSLPSFQGQLSDFYHHYTNTPIVVGTYFSAYHSCPGGPSIYYDYTLLKDALASTMSAGAMVYTSQFFSGGDHCASTADTQVPESKVCAVLKNFEK